MRRYLYAWHTLSDRRLVLSGVEFSDLLPELDLRGVILLRHDYDEVRHDRANRLQYVAAADVGDLAAENVYGFGDFCWADVGVGVRVSNLTDQAVAELMFFSHATRPLAGVEIPGLGNRLLWWAHDDGWFAYAYYTQWDVIEGVLRRSLATLLGEDEQRRVIEHIRRGDGAVWCNPNQVIDIDPAEPREDIDRLQMKYMPRS